MRRAFLGEMLGRRFRPVGLGQVIQSYRFLRNAEPVLAVLEDSGDERRGDLEPAPLEWTPQPFWTIP